MVRDREVPDNPWIRLVIGATILAVGVILWLDQTDRLDASDYFRWWPVVVIAMGLAHLPQRLWGGAAIWLMIGIAFLLPLLGIIPRITVVRLIGLWPLLIAYGGFTLVLQALKPVPPGGGVFHAAAVMGGNVRTVSSSNFVAGDALAVMGGCVIDLSSAKIESEATIDVLAFWGGIEIRVPRSIRVESRVVGVLGGASNLTVTPPEGAPRLIIRGSAIMGGVEVKNSAEDKA